MPTFSIVRAHNNKERNLFFLLHVSLLECQIRNSLARALAMFVRRRFSNPTQPKARLPRFRGAARDKRLNLGRCADSEAEQRLEPWRNCTLISSCEWRGRAPILPRSRGWRRIRDSKNLAGKLCPRAQTCTEREKERKRAREFRNVVKFRTEPMTIDVTIEWTRREKGFAERTGIFSYSRGEVETRASRLRRLRRPMHLGTSEIRARHTRERHTCELC